MTTHSGEEFMAQRFFAFTHIDFMRVRMMLHLKSVVALQSLALSPKVKSLHER